MNTYVKVAQLDQVPPGRTIGVEVDGVRIALYNAGGQIFATRDSCAHQAWPLSRGYLRGKYVTCGLHQWVFDVTNGEYQGNPDVHVACFDVKIEGSDVLVSTTPRTPPPRPFVSRDDA